VIENHPNGARRWLAAAVKLAIVALVVWYVRRTLVDAWEQLGQRRWNATSGGWRFPAPYICLERFGAPSSGTARCER